MVLSSRFPGEFEPQQSIWLSWPTKYSYALRNRTPEHVLLEMISVLLEKNNKNGEQFNIDLLVQDAQEKEQVMQLISDDRIRYHIIPHFDMWMRDMGPIFTIAKNGLSIIDFGFDMWSYYETYEPNNITDENVKRVIASRLSIPLVRSSIISEGGDRELNGLGTLITSKVVEWRRNKNNFTHLSQIQDELSRVLNVTKVIWMNEGVADDRCSLDGVIPNTRVYSMLGTGGHVDEYVRFIDAKTIALAYVPEEDFHDHDLDAVEIAKLTHANMEDNYAILCNETDQDGQPFKIVRIPVPHPIFEYVDRRDPIFDELREMNAEIKENDTIKCIIAASYLNFLISNHVVLISKYWKHGRDERIKQRDEHVLKQFQQLFPNRDIVQINAEDINISGGGMHCISQQMPRLL
jgi:agmatine deiminase